MEERLQVEEIALRETRKSEWVKGTSIRVRNDWLQRVRSRLHAKNVVAGAIDFDVS